MIPTLPITPSGAAQRFFEGTPMGLTYGDPQWGYGNAQIGSMTKEESEVYKASHGEFKGTWKEYKEWDLNRSVDARIKRMEAQRKWWKEEQRKKRIRREKQIRIQQEEAERRKRFSRRQAARKITESMIYTPINVSHGGHHYTPQPDTNSSFSLWFSPF